MCLKKLMISTFAIIRQAVSKSMKENYSFTYDFKGNLRNSGFRIQSSFHFQKNRLRHDKSHLDSQVFYTVRGKKCSRISCYDLSRVYDVLPKSKSHHRAEIGNDRRPVDSGASGENRRGRSTNRAREFEGGRGG